MSSSSRKQPSTRPLCVAIGIGEAAHDIDHAAGEIDFGLEFGVLAGERALDSGRGGGGEIAIRLAEPRLRRPRARAGPRLDGGVDEMANQIDVEIRDDPRQAVGHHVEHLRVAQEARRALHAEAMERQLGLVHRRRHPAGDPRESPYLRGDPDD